MFILEVKQSSFSVYHKEMGVGGGSGAIAPVILSVGVISFMTLSLYPREKILL
jgi:hypothetical protein